MTSYPRTCQPGHAPRFVHVLVQQVLPRLLVGDHPDLAALREQCRTLTIGEVELSGVGFFATLQVAEDAPRAQPERLVGGNALIRIRGFQYGAGCVLFVEHGRLSLLEGYANAGEEWTDDAEVLEVGEVMPIRPPA